MRLVNYLSQTSYRSIRRLDCQSPRTYTRYFRAAPPRSRSFRPVGPPRSPVIEASLTSFTFVVIVACGSAVALEYWSRSTSRNTIDSLAAVRKKEDGNVQVRPNMQAPEGHLGNLTPEQETALKNFWVVTLKTFGVQDQDNPASQEAELSADGRAESIDSKKKSRGLSIFSRKHDTSSSTTKNSGTAAEDDKYGQSAELQQILAEQPAESLRMSYWNMLKTEHPDQLLLRFLRARKWDVERALAMMITTLHWRTNIMKVDDDIVSAGEEGAVKDEQSSDAYTKREGHDFLAQLRMGKSFLHGTDNDDRPVTYVRARLHYGGQQTERALERFTVYVIETARLSLKAPVETACIIFDMTGFTMANMDYTPVKFMIKIFEANYPESLGLILVHKAPWLFQGIWRIIRGWLDPVVAGKVHFTNSAEGMSEFIPKNQIIKEVGGDEDWEYSYVEPVSGENTLMADTETRARLLATRNDYIKQYQRQTFEWIRAGSDSELSQKIRNERNSTAQRLNQNYWELDPYVRARSLYDRVGMISPGGAINFSPRHTLKLKDTAKESSEEATAEAH